jgi:hypothetical protein
MTKLIIAYRKFCVRSYERQVKVTMYLKVQKVTYKGRCKMKSFIVTSRYSPNIVIAKLPRT